MHMHVSLLPLYITMGYKTIYCIWYAPCNYNSAVEIYFVMDVRHVRYIIIIALISAGHNSEMMVFGNCAFHLQT